MASQDREPLAGIVVVDMTRVLAGPFANMVLRDLGADIIKVEPPHGDDARGFGPFLPGGASSYFVSLNCGKRSIALDLKNAAGREVFADLLRAADVLIESFRPGVLARLGFDDERVRALNERLVYVTCSGFGYTGPDAGKPAYDMIIQGRSGLLSITGTESGETVRVGTSIADIVSGLYAVIGVLAGLLRRERGAALGSGARVDIAMLDSVVSVLENAVARYQATGAEPGPLGSRHPSITPFETFRTADGQIVIAAGNDRLFGRLCRGAGGVGPGVRSALRRQFRPHRQPGHPQGEAGGCAGAARRRRLDRGAGGGRRAGVAGRGRVPTCSPIRRWRPATCWWRRPPRTDSA